MTEDFRTRLGLCCTFKEAPISFRTTTVRHLTNLRASSGKEFAYLSAIAKDNCQSLLKAIQYCSSNRIGAFRINSQFLPAYTHPEVGYTLDDLPESDEIKHLLHTAKNLAQERNIRLTFHPDQFVVLNSPRSEVVEQSILELEYHGILADLVGADVINIHGGGAYGNKAEALDRFAINFSRLSPNVREKLTLENDDRTYTPSDLIDFCKRIGIPFVYDVHHHRCLPDTLSIEEATALALSTWNREPLFHLSSPKDGWKSPKPHLHHDFINVLDMPEFWISIRPLTIDIEAKGKELALSMLRNDLKNSGWKITSKNRTTL